MKKTNPIRIHEIAGDLDVRITWNSTWRGWQDRRDRWSPREIRQDWHVLYAVAAGSYYAWLNGIEQRIAPGSLLWWPAGTALTLTWPDHTRFIEVWFQARRHGALVAVEPLPVHAAQASEAQAILERLCDALITARAGDDLLPRLLLAQVLLLLRASGTEDAGAHAFEHDAGLTASQRRQLTNWMASHVEHDPAPADLARVLQLTPDYFARRFHATYGSSPRRWIADERMRYAACLLRDTDLPVQMLAKRLGFSGPEPFCRQFRRCFHTTPTAFRRT